MNQLRSFYKIRLINTFLAIFLLVQAGFLLGLPPAQYATNKGSYEGQRDQASTAIDEINLTGDLETAKASLAKAQQTLDEAEKSFYEGLDKPFSTDKNNAVLRQNIKKEANVDWPYL